MGILDELTAAARERVAAATRKRSLGEVSRAAMAELNSQRMEGHMARGGAAAVRGVSTPRGPLFWLGQSLFGENIGFVCELKKASPGVGAIVDEFDPVKDAVALGLAGACAICYATEPTMYAGSDDVFSELRDRVEVPLIRRDVFVDEYQLYESKAMGASAVALSCAILDEGTLKDFLGVCDSLSMDAVVEVHNEAELGAALDAGARIFAADNRDPQTGEVDFGVTARLRPLVPEGCAFIAASGVKGPEDVVRLALCYPDAIMVGEAIMRAKLKGLELGKYRYDSKKALLAVEKELEEKRKEELGEEDGVVAAPPAPDEGIAAGGRGVAGGTAPLAPPTPVRLGD